LLVLIFPLKKSEQKNDPRRSLRLYGESKKLFLFLNNRHRSRPTCTGAFDFDRKTAYGKSMGSSDGRQVGHFFHMAVADVDTGEVRLPNNFGVTVFLEFGGLKRQGTVPTPGVDTDDLDA
jgi:hypothetical protein